MDGPKEAQVLTVETGAYIKEGSQLSSLIPISSTSQTLVKSRRRHGGERTRRRGNYSGEKKKPWLADRRVGGQGLEEEPIKEGEVTSMADLRILGEVLTDKKREEEMDGYG